MTKERCERCFNDATHVIFGKWMNGRPVEEPVCTTHVPTSEEVGTIRLYDTWHHARHRAKEYRIEGVR